MGRILFLWSVLLFLAASPSDGRAADQSTFLIGQGQKQNKEGAPPGQGTTPSQRPTERGTLESIDLEGKTLTVNGKVFHFTSPKWLLEGEVEASSSDFKPGDSVRIAYQDQNGSYTAFRIIKLGSSGSSPNQAQPTKSVGSKKGSKSSQSDLTVSGIIENMDFISETFHMNDKNFTLDGKARVLVDGEEKSLAALHESDMITVTYREQVGVNIATLVSKGGSAGSSASTTAGKAHTSTPTEIGRENKASQADDQKLTTMSGTIESIDTAMGTLNLKGESFLVSSKVEVFESSVDGTKISLSSLKNGDAVKLICKTGDTKTIVRVIRDRPFVGKPADEGVKPTKELSSGKALPSKTSGPIESLNKSENTLVVGGKTLVFGSKSKVLLDGSPTAFSDLNDGDNVIVVYNEEDCVNHVDKVFTQKPWAK